MFGALQSHKEHVLLSTLFTTHFPIMAFPLFSNLPALWIVPHKAAIPFIYEALHIPRRLILVITPSYNLLCGSLQLFMSALSS